LENSYTFYDRFLALFDRFISEFIFIPFKCSEFASALSEENRHHAFKYPTNQLNLLLGVEGFIENYALPPNVKFVYPFMKNKTAEEIPPEMKQFLD